jgi:hypothetical protein
MNAGQVDPGGSDAIIIIDVLCAKLDLSLRRAPADGPAIVTNRADLGVSDREGLDVVFVVKGARVRGDAVGGVEVGGRVVVLRVGSSRVIAATGAEGGEEEQAQGPALRGHR